MASPFFPKPVKLILATLDGDEAVAAQARTRLCTAFGEIDFISSRFPFAATDYYATEMGKPLYRRFYAFAGLISPETLPAIKLRTHALENELAVLLVEALNLEVAAADIAPEAPLYGEGLGLDSIDILEVALEVSRRYGFQLCSDDERNQQIFSSLRSLAAHVAQNRTAP